LTATFDYSTALKNTKRNGSRYCEQGKAIRLTSSLSGLFRRSIACVMLRSGEALSKRLGDAG
jgi:hypothetical protein